MQVLIDKNERASIKKLVGKGMDDAGRNSKIRFIKLDFENKQVVASDGMILVVLADKLPNDLARAELGVKKDLLIPYSQIKTFDGLGKVEIRTLYDLSEKNGDGKIIKKPVPVLTAYDIKGAEYSEILDFVSGENDYIDYESMLTSVQHAKQNALFTEELASYGVTRFMPRLEEGARKLDANANITINKEFVESK